MKDSIINKKLYTLCLSIMGVLVLLFGYISIQSIINLKENFTVLASHPLVVASSAYRLRTIITENKLKIHMFSAENSFTDVSMIHSALDDMEKHGTAELDIMFEKYLGPRKTVEDLQTAFLTIMQLETNILQNPTNYTGPTAQNFIKEHLDPQYDHITKLTENMLTFITGTVDRLTTESTIIVRTVAFSTLFFILSFGVIIVFFNRSIAARTRDRQYNDFLLKVLSSHADAVFMVYNVKTDQMEFVFANAERILGIHPDVLTHDRLALFQYCTSPEISSLAAAFEAKTITECIERECVYTNPLTSKESWISFAVYPVTTEDDLERYIISVRDLTTAKRNQQVLNDALSSAQSANAAKSDFLARMSHEIRTPLNAIIGMGSIAATSLDNKNRIQDCLNKINLSSKHLLTLVNDILDMAKIESGKFSIMHEKFNVSDLMRNLVSLILPEMKEKNHTLSVNLPIFSYEMLMGDAVRLNQILLNILSNAIKYTNEGGKISLEVEEREGTLPNSVSLRITVSDNGIGMTEAFQQKIFLPFEQEERTMSARRSSTGMGMVITKNLVQLMNGVVIVHSKANEGSTFIIELPFTVHCEPDCPCKNELQNSGLRVLFVDTNPVTCNAAALFFSKMGIPIDWAYSSEEAYAKTLAAQEQGAGYNVALIDWEILELNGSDITTRLHALMGDALSIIVISPYDIGSRTIDPAAYAINGFLPKPLSKSPLLNLLAHLTVSEAALSSCVLKAESAPPEFSFEGKRILAVDDVAINMEIIDILLTEHGADITKATNGKEALDIFATSPQGYYDIILMDIQMPVMDGYTATKAIRQLSRQDAATIPIIAMTANAFSEDVLLATNAGMNYHIAKPIDPPTLYLALEQFLTTNARDVRQ